MGDGFSKKVWVMMMCLVSVLTLTGLVTAGPNDPETPTALKGGKVITVDEAKSLVDKKSSSVFDMRTPLNYGKGHIPTAVSLPYKGKSENTRDADLSKDQIDLSKLPSDKNAKIIIYSDGPKGWKSYKAALIAIKAGYNNVLWLRDGFVSWEKKNYQVER